MELSEYSTYMMSIHRVSKITVQNCFFFRTLSNFHQYW